MTGGEGQVLLVKFGQKERKRFRYGETGRKDGSCISIPTTIVLFT